MFRSSGYVKQITINHHMENYYVEEEYLIMWRNLGQNRNCNSNLKIYTQIKNESVNTKIESSEYYPYASLCLQMTCNAK